MSKVFEMASAPNDHTAVNGAEVPAPQEPMEENTDHDMMVSAIQLADWVAKQAPVQACSCSISKWGSVCTRALGTALTVS